MVMAEIVERDVVEHVADAVADFFPDAARHAGTGSVTRLLRGLRTRQQAVDERNRPFDRRDDFANRDFLRAARKLLTMPARRSGAMSCSK